MTKLIILALTLTVGLVATDSTERRLADRLARANRAAVLANQMAQEAGDALDKYCITQGKRAGLHPAGVWGCVPTKP